MILFESTPAVDQSDACIYWDSYSSVFRYRTIVAIDCIILKCRNIYESHSVPLLKVIAAKEQLD